jgi:epsilon-lactone hydrolase
MSSTETRQFDEFLDGLSANIAGAGGNLDLVRAVCEGLHGFGSEPEDVTYAEVDANGVPAMWAIPAGADTEHALVHFHMGGTVVASMHSDRKAAGHIARAAGIRSLNVDFRRSPENKFPAQVDDAVTAFEWLVENGYEPANIGTVGHSVGGYLAVMTALTLRDTGRPTPGAIVSISPWCDLEIGNETIDSLDERDRLLSRGLLEFFRDCWLGGTGVEFTDPRVSLLHADLTGLPPTSLYYGTEEILAGEDAEFGDLLVKAGVDARVYAVENAQHSFVIAAGRVPEVDHAIAEMGQWLRTTLGVTDR